MEKFKCGYVGIIGKTNAGKSSLINKLIGQKVAIVSPKTQTTRNNILGIKTENDYQMIFIDTPGIHKSKNFLDKKMMKDVRQAISSVDVILYVLDSTKNLFEEEIDYIKHISESVPVVIGISKVDLPKKEKVFELMSKLALIENILAIVPFSSKEEKNLNIIMDEILKALPEYNEKMLIYDEDLFTDKSVRFLTSEIIREKTLLALDDEIPHGIAVFINRFDEKDNITIIDVDLICERDSHKSIIIGKGGTKLKEIGSKAREDIEKLLDKKILLNIWVKVQKDWRTKETGVADLIIE